MDVKQLERLIGAGEIDTVLVALPDLQGRLMGKRFTGRHFLDDVVAAGHPMHACNYLLDVDVDMTPLPGYSHANWEQGYGDMNAVPDFTTLRLIPWLPATVLVLCDVIDDRGAPVEVSPRRILQRQVERAAAMGYSVKIGAELEFFLFRDSYEEAGARGYRDLIPHAGFNQDYAILQTSRDEYLIRQIRNGMEAAGVPVEFSKGEAAAGQHEINLAYSDPVEMADRHAVYKNGVKEIAAAHGLAATFMAKWSFAEVGSSCHLHASLWNADGSAPLGAHGTEGAGRMSEPFRHFLGGLVASSRDLIWLLAPYVNSYKRYQEGSWAPTAIVWGLDNRTCGLRVIGDGPSLRVESRIPGADCNPYLAYAAVIAAGLHGIEQRLDPGPPFEGDAYRAGDTSRVPTTLVEAIDALETSTMARHAFGVEVVDHFLNTARQEWLSFQRTVTDWELRRNFERI